MVNMPNNSKRAIGLCFFLPFKLSSNVANIFSKNIFSIFFLYINIMSRIVFLYKNFRAISEVDDENK